MFVLASATVAFGGVAKFHQDSALNGAEKKLNIDPIPHLTAGDEKTSYMEANAKDGLDESAEFWSRAMMASMPVGGEATTWYQTPGCRKSVFYGTDLKLDTVVTQTESTPGIKVATYNFRSHPTDDTIIGTGQLQAQYFIGGNFDGTRMASGSNLFNGKGGFGQGEIFLVDYRTDVLGAANPSNAFVGDSGWAITGGHGDFKCATGWKEKIKLVEPKKLTFNDKGEWDQNITGLIWRSEMYLCGICENSA